MKIVVSYGVGSYECAYEAHTPIEYESKEALALVLEEQAKKLLELRNKWVVVVTISDLKLLTENRILRQQLENFHNIMVDELISEGVYDPPTIRTLEEWFEEQSLS